MAKNKPNNQFNSLGSEADVNKQDGMDNVADSAMSDAVNTSENLKDAPKNIKDGVNNIKDTANNIKDTASKANKSIKDAGGVKKAINNKAKSIGNSIKNAPKNIANGIKNAPKNIASGIKNTSKNIANGIKNIPKNIVNGIKNLPQNALRGLKNKLSELNPVTKVMNKINEARRRINRIRTAPKRFVKAVKNTIKTTKKAVKMAVKATKSAIKAIKLAIKLVIKTAMLLAKLLMIIIQLIIAFIIPILIASAIIAVVFLFSSIVNWILDNDSTSDNKSYNGETSEYNETTLDEDGNVALKSISNNTKLTEAFYQYFAEKSLWVVYEGTVYNDTKIEKDNEYGGVYEPMQYNSPEFKEKFVDDTTNETILKDAYNRESMFYLNPNSLFVFDKYLNKEEFRFPEQFVLHVAYEGDIDTIKNGGKYKLKQLTDDDYRLTAESQKYKLSKYDSNSYIYVPDGDEKVKGIWDYGLGSILHYVKYIVKHENRGSYTNFEVWDTTENIDSSTGLITSGEVKKFDSYESYENDANKNNYKVTNIADLKGDDRLKTYTAKDKPLELADEEKYFIDWVVTAAGDVSNEVAYEWKDSNVPFTEVETIEKEVTQTFEEIKSKTVTESVSLDCNETYTYHTYKKLPNPVRDSSGKLLSATFTDVTSTITNECSGELDEKGNITHENCKPKSINYSYTEEYVKKVSKKVKQTFLATVEGTKWDKSPYYDGSPNIENLTGKRYYEDYITHYKTYVPENVTGFFDYDIMLKRMNIEGTDSEITAQLDELLQRESITEVGNSTGWGGNYGDSGGSSIGSGSNKFEQCYNGSYKETIERIWDGLISWGFSPEQAAALLGNIAQESTFNYLSVNPNGGASGLVQWTSGRFKGLNNFAKSKGLPDWKDLDTQIQYMCMELDYNAKYSFAEFNIYEKEYKDTFLNSSDVSEITIALTRGYERCGKNEAMESIRIDNAMSAYLTLKDREIEYPIEKITPSSTSSSDSSSGGGIFSSIGNAFSNIWDWVAGAMEQAKDALSLLFGKDEYYNILEEKERTQWGEYAISEDNIDYILSSIFAYTDSVPISDFYGKLDDEFFKEKYAELFSNPIGTNWNSSFSNTSTSSEYAKLKQKYFPDGFEKPLKECVLSSTSSKYGIYLQTTNGENVKSPTDGEIVEVGNDTRYGGDYIIISNGSSKVIIGGIKNISVIKGNKVTKGQVIGVADGSEIFFGITNTSNVVVDPGFILSSFSNLNIAYPTTGPYQTMPVIKQTDPAISSYAYGPTSIGVGGCGITSFSMVLSELTGTIYSPADMADTLNRIATQRGTNWTFYYQAGVGSKHNIFAELCKVYGLNIQDGSGTSDKAIKSQLDQGRIVIIGISKSGNSVYTGKGHFITIRGYDKATGKYYINDSNNSSKSSYNENTLYSYSQLGSVNSARAIWK